MILCHRKHGPLDKYGVTFHAGFEIIHELPCTTKTWGDIKKIGNNNPTGSVSSMVDKINRQQQKNRSETLFESFVETDNESEAELTSSSDLDASIFDAENGDFLDVSKKWEIEC